MGIPDNELEAVFDKFVQSSKTRTGAGGTGLGLSISREIVHGHKGRIWAENRSDGGAVFSFEIPIEPSLADARAAAQSPATSIPPVVVSTPDVPDVPLMGLA